MNILHKLLNKFNVERQDQLNIEEQKEYERLKQALIGRKLTDKDVQDFVFGAKERSITKLRKATELSDRELIYWSVMLDVYSNIINFLETPDVERKQANQQVEGLLNN